MLCRYARMIITHSLSLFSLPPLIPFVLLLKRLNIFVVFVFVCKDQIIYMIICIVNNGILSASSIAGCVAVDSVGDRTTTTCNNTILSLTPYGVSFIFFFFVFVCILRVERLLIDDLMAGWRRVGINRSD